MELRIQDISQTYSNGVAALKNITLTIPVGIFCRKSFMSGREFAAAKFSEHSAKDILLSDDDQRGAQKFILPEIAAPDFRMNRSRF